MTRMTTTASALHAEKTKGRGAMTAAAKKTPTAAAPYTMDKGAVYRAGKKVGVVQNGSYQFVDEHGKQHAGSFARLIQAQVVKEVSTSGAGPTGKLRFDGQTAEVMGGVVFLNGKRLGAVDARGQYALELDARKHAGDVHATPGAVWIGKGGGTAVIDIGGLRFVSTDGAIHDGPELIGWLQTNGRFRAVRNNGDSFEGQLGKPASYLYLRRTPGK